MIVPPRGRIPEISLQAERLEQLLDHPAPAFADADDLVAARPGAPRDRADDRVQAGAVAAAGQDSDPQLDLSLRSPAAVRAGYPIGQVPASRWTGQ